MKEGSLMAKNAAIYGAGYSGARVYAELSSMGYEIDLMVDSNPDVRGKIGPDRIVISDPIDLSGYEGTVFMGCAGGVALRETIKENFGLTADYTVNWRLHKERLVEYWRTRNQDFSKISKLWQDESSSVLWKLLTRHAPVENSEILDIPVLSDYFEEIFSERVSHHDIIVAGASVGEELASLDTNSPLLRQAYLYEPNAVSFSLLKTEISKLANPDTFVCRPFALGEVPAELFLTSQGTTSRIIRDKNLDEAHLSQKSGLFRIQQTTIDREVKELQISPTILTFDVEGAEMNALRGATETIKESRPILAVSAYHNPSDLYDIVEFVDSLNQGYEYELRARDFGFVDLTIFCVPSSG